VKDATVAPIDLDALVREATRLYNHEGEKMTEDNVQAFSLFFRAAMNGHSEAQLHVSACYKYGRGIEENLAESERWLRIAAANESPKALFVLGFAYRSGGSYPNIAKDEEEAIKCFRIVAEKGGTIGRNACLYMATIYKERNDATEELRWTKEATLRGYTDSLWDVKGFYEQQELTTMDLAAAYAWLLLFADHSDCETKAGELKALMSPSELEIANRLYRDYTKKRSEWANKGPGQ
jgi:TPR repeat protein